MPLLFCTCIKADSDILMNMSYIVCLHRVSNDSCDVLQKDLTVSGRTAHVMHQAQTH